MADDVWTEGVPYSYRTYMYTRTVQDMPEAAHPGIRYTHLRDVGLE